MDYRRRDEIESLFADGFDDVTSELLEVDSIIRPLTGGPAVELSAVAVVLVTVASAAAAWVLSHRYRNDSRPPAFRFALAIAIVGGFLSWTVITDISDAHRLVEDYCSFGAVSERQLQSCQTHVSANHIRAIDTPASICTESEISCPLRSCGRRYFTSVACPVCSGCGCCGNESPPITPRWLTISIWPESRRSTRSTWTKG